MKTVSKQDVRDARLHEEDQTLISSIDEIIDDVRQGKHVIIVDDEDRENEGDLIIAAECATPEAINFMAKEGRGLICLPMECAMVERLGLELMGRGDNTHHRTAFTVSIEAKEGVTTGISAADRSKTILTAIDPKTGAHDIATPGHIFPLRAEDGGTLVRAGHTEASVDLAKMAGFSAAGVICEIMNDDGTMARLPDLVGFAQRHNLKIGTIADLIAYRRQNETIIECIYNGDHKSGFTLHLYRNKLDGTEHIALAKGDISGNDPIRVRMHAANPLKDFLQPDNAVRAAMSVIENHGRGVIVILRDSDPESLSKQLKNDQKTQKSDKELRNYGVGAQILQDLGIKNMILLTNNPKTPVGLDGYDLQIVKFEEIGE